MPWFTRRKRDTMVACDPAAVYAPPMDIPSQKLDYRIAGASRDTFIVDLVQRFGLLTSDLIITRVALERFAGLTSAHNVHNRLKLLTGRKEMHNLGRISTGHVVYAAKPTRGNARRHIAHDLGVARFGITLECVAQQLEGWCCDQAALRQEFKQGDRPFIPDARFLLGNFQHYLEYHTGSQDDETRIVGKLKAYKRHHEQLKELVKIDASLSTKMRVLFVCVQERNVEKLGSIIARNYGETMLFWVANEGAYLGNPGALCTAIWQVGKTGDSAMRGLLETRERE